MFFCGNPFFASCDRQVSPVFEAIRFLPDRNEVCTHCQYRRLIVGIGDLNGPKFIDEEAERGLFLANVLTKPVQRGGKDAAFFPYCPLFVGKKLNFEETIRHQRPVRILFARAMFLQFVGETRDSVELLADWQAHVATLDYPNLILCRNPLHASF